VHTPCFSFLESMFEARYGKIHLLGWEDGCEASRATGNGHSTIS
jgi:hypothetical protein